ncbi:MAG TPA: methyltransferase domain-containing protein [Longimicrobiales bacterium]|nr:methyltransferase domain-containing protein [Longimicrobiales bacterium]
MCALAWVPPEHRLDAAAERARYETHENDPADPGYRQFLDRLASPLIQRLRPGDQGLDYGSGPGPTLSLMLAEAGFPTAIYDPFFASDPTPLTRAYRFITCTETVEHFYQPAGELDRLDSLLKPGGLLAVMTRPRDGEDLESWWYARDPTHVCFYHSRTMRWIAESRGWALERPHPHVFLFRKPVQKSDNSV